MSVEWNFLHIIGMFPPYNLAALEGAAAFFVYCYVPFQSLATLAYLGLVEITKMLFDRFMAGR